jgi:hypothetical protein
MRENEKNCNFGAQRRNLLPDGAIFMLNRVIYMPDNSQSYFDANTATPMRDRENLVPIGAIMVHNFVADRSWARPDKNAFLFSYVLVFSPIPFSAMSNPVASYLLPKVELL